MSIPLSTVSLTVADKAYLQGILANRWRAVWRRLLFTVALPAPVVVLVLYAVNVYILYRMQVEEMDEHTQIPAGVEDYALLWLAIPVLAVPLLANIFMFIRSIPPLYIDLKCGVKKLFPFTPKPYKLPHSDKYYVEVGYPALRFLEVTQEQYMQMDYTQNCYLMLSPLAAVPLGIQTATDTYLNQ